MGEPASLDDYEARFSVAHIVTGFGVNRTTHVPCPFCAAADWMVYKDDDAKRTMTDEHLCEVCARSARFEIRRAADDSASAELVQTGGPDPPRWMTAPRRA